MNAFKKLLTLALIGATFGFSIPQADAAEYASTIGGCGYAECRKCPSLAPAVALGTIALVAIVAVAIQNQNHGHSHGH